MDCSVSDKMLRHRVKKPTNRVKASESLLPRSTGRYLCRRYTAEQSMPLPCFFLITRGYQLSIQNLPPMGFLGGVGAACHEACTNSYVMGTTQSTPMNTGVLHLSPVGGLRCTRVPGCKTLLLVESRGVMQGSCSCPEVQVCPRDSLWLLMEPKTSLLPTKPLFSSLVSTISVHLLDCLPATHL